MIVLFQCKLGEHCRAVILHPLTNISVHAIKSFRDDFPDVRTVCLFHHVLYGKQVLQNAVMKEIRKFEV